MRPDTRTSRPPTLRLHTKEPQDWRSALGFLPGSRPTREAIIEAYQRRVWAAIGLSPKHKHFRAALREYVSGTRRRRGGKGLETALTLALIECGQRRVAGRRTG